MIRIALALAIFATQTAPAAADPASIVAGVVVGLLANAGVAAAVLNIVAYAVYIGTFVAIG